MFQANCYVLSCQDGQESIIIDPGFDDPGEAEKILKFIHENKLTLKYIVNTHGHPDHTCGNRILKQTFNTPILIHEDDAHIIGELGKMSAASFGIRNYSPPADALLKEGDLVRFGNTALKVLHTPGHSRGSISLLGEKEVFTGDTLFAGSIGRMDFPDSSERDMKASLDKLASLPYELAVYPGHGPTTTIGQEKASNPFLQQPWL
jgi:glyoxylase-like metal-dependent hydrolase (beta-lactamase superfamily II)